MKKILVADLFDTLLPNTPPYLSALYGMKLKNDLSSEYLEYAEKFQDMAMQDLVLELNEYLKDNNELVVVTNLDHMSLDCLTDQYIYKILEELSKYKDKIKLYLVGRKGDLTHSYSILNYAKVSEIDGNICIDRNGIKFGFLTSKEDVFDLIDITNKELFTIGDRPKVDLGMLLKGVELNGKASLINLYSSEIANEEYNDNTLTLKLKQALAYYDLEEKADRLIELFNNKELSINELYRIQFLYEALEIYNFARVCPPNRKERITDTVYIENTLERIEITPSFKEYHRRLIHK